MTNALGTRAAQGTKYSNYIIGVISPFCRVVVIATLETFFVLTNQVADHPLRALSSSLRGTVPAKQSEPISWVIM